MFTDYPSNFPNVGRTWPLALIIFFALFCFRNLQAMQKKEPSLLVFLSSESEEDLEPLGEPNVAEPVERISEDIAEVYNVAITLTEHLKHELNSVVRVDF